MAIQMIFCVETNKRADTDSIYISETLDYYYEKSNQIKISKVYMTTKSKYNAKDVQREIEQKIKAFTIGKSRVIYCIDTDQYEKDSNHANELKNVMQYCEDNNFDLIWFCHDVEEVFLGEKISKSQKVQRAGAFRKKKMIEGIKSDKLSGKVRRVGVSNILSVLDKYLPRK